MERKQLYIDFDGVIMDTIDVTYKLLEEQKISLQNEKEVENFYKTIDWKNLLSITPEINDGFNCIEKIRESNLFDIAILTHVNSLDEAIEKVKFIRKHTIDLTIIPVPKAISKTKMVHTEGAILIDDYTSNLTEWEASGGIGIRFNRSLNGKGFKVIDRLDKILEMNLVKQGLNGSIRKYKKYKNI
ncbi:MAG: hypothetical protein MR227_00365 [Firmicutes bacterium]|nr:hypothetical protein [Bacillota bacterium]